MIDYAALTAVLTDCETHQMQNTSNNALARAKEKSAKERATQQAQRQVILKSLSNISNDIKAEIDSVNDQIEATSELLLSALSAYGHGLLMKPIHATTLPSITSTL